MLSCHFNCLILANILFFAVRQNVLSEQKNTEKELELAPEPKARPWAQYVINSSFKLSWSVQQLQQFTWSFQQDPCPKQQQHGSFGMFELPSSCHTLQILSFLPQLQVCPLSSNPSIPTAKGLSLQVLEYFKPLELMASTRDTKYVVGKQNHKMIMWWSMYVMIRSMLYLFIKGKKKNELNIIWLWKLNLPVIYFYKSIALMILLCPYNLLLILILNCHVHQHTVVH